MKIQITPVVEAAFKRLLKGPVDYVWVNQKGAIPEYRIKNLITTDVYCFAAGYQAGVNATQPPQGDRT